MISILLIIAVIIIAIVGWNIAWSMIAGISSFFSLSRKPMTYEEQKRLENFERYGC